MKLLWRRGHRGAIYSGTPTHSTLYSGNHRFYWSARTGITIPMSVMSAQASRKERTAEDSVSKSAMFWGSLEAMWLWNVPQTAIFTIMMQISGQYWLFCWISFAVISKLSKLKIKSLYFYSLVHKANKSMCFILLSHLETPVTNVVTFFSVLLPLDCNKSELI